VTEPRTLRLRRDERRAQLLDAARSVFVLNGYHAAAMDDIAVRAGVSKPVVYQHFPSKLDLYLALLDESIEALVATVQDAIDSTPDNHQRVAAAIEAYFAFVDEGSEDFRLVYESDLTSSAGVRVRLDDANRQCAQALADAIARQTDLAEPDALVLGVALAGMAQVTAQSWLSAGRPVPRSQACQLVTALAWRGLAGFPVVEQPADQPHEPGPAPASTEPPAPGGAGQGVAG
jgi:AcrR family transcriptional regulator